MVSVRRVHIYLVQAFNSGEPGHAYCGTNFRHAVAALIALYNEHNANALEFEPLKLDRENPQAAIDHIRLQLTDYAFGRMFTEQVCEVEPLIKVAAASSSSDGESASAFE